MRDLMIQYISSGDGNIRGALLSFGGDTVTVVYNDIQMGSSSSNPGIHRITNYIMNIF